MRTGFLPRDKNGKYTKNTFLNVIKDLFYRLLKKIK